MPTCMPVGSAAPLTTNERLDIYSAQTGRPLLDPTPAQRRRIVHKENRNVVGDRAAHNERLAAARADRLRRREEQPRLRGLMRWIRPPAPSRARKLAAKAAEGARQFVRGGAE